MILRASDDRHLIRGALRPGSISHSNDGVVAPRNPGIVAVVGIRANGRVRRSEEHAGVFVATTGEAVECDVRVEDEVREVLGGALLHCFAARGRLVRLVELPLGGAPRSAIGRPTGHSRIVEVVVEERR